MKSSACFRKSAVLCGFLLIVALVKNVSGDATIQVNTEMATTQLGSARTRAAQSQCGSVPGIFSKSISTNGLPALRGALGWG